MSKRIISLCSIILIGLSSLAQANDLDYKPGELLVRFAPKTNGLQRTKAEQNEILTSINAGSVKHSYKLVSGLTVVKLPTNRTVKNTVGAFKGMSGILYAHPNYKIKLLSTGPNDTNFDDLWGMHNTGQTGGTPDADIDAPEAWNIKTDAGDIIVAVLDTGIDYEHTDLAGNMWVNEVELNGTADVDDDDNGYIDDIYGWDFADDDNNPTDYYGHGTHCAGTIGAVGNNDEGVAGVCWDVKIMTVKIFPNYGEETFISGAIDAIEYAVDNGADILNNSWGGGDPNQALEDVIEAVGDAGVLFIVAAGNYPQSPWFDNDVTPFYPANYNCNNIISVMATDHDDDMSSFSHYGANSVDLAAPGSGILSCVPGNDYESWSGTSMATPHVAGACALVWAANPQLTHLEVKDYILQGVDKLDSLEGKCVSEGRLNLYRAVKGKTAFPYLTLSKDVNDVNCVYPFEPFIGNYLTYDICYDANGSADTNAVIVDYLPDEVEYYTSDSNGTYDPNKHTVTWRDIGDISEEDSDCVTVTVKVTAAADPGGSIINTCEIEGDNYIATDSKVSCVECWAGDLLYVDADANDGGDGFSWDSAYNDLQEAIDTARTYDCYTAIWVAEGNYPPVESTDVENYKDYSFELLENVALFGHFGGIGTYEYNVSQRDFADANNETILEGQIGANDDDAVEDIITAKDINGVVDGFTIQNSYRGAGIYLSESDVDILNCKFKNNSNYGVEAFYYSEPNIHNCLFMDNTEQGVKATSDCKPTVSYCIFDGNGTTYDGIYMASNCDMAVSDCVFKKHTKYGIESRNSTLTVTDCNFDDNKSGLYLSDVDTTITNCSIKNSDYYGMRCHNSVLTVEHSVIAKNGTNGLYTGDDCELTLKNSVIRDSGRAGLDLRDNSATTLTNNWIHNNGTDQSPLRCAGIYFYTKETGSVPLVRNNTIYGNYTYGIQVNKQDIYDVAPNVINCIIYGNGSNDFFRNTGTFDTVNYCCLEDGHDGTGNITTPPTFKTTDPNDFHLDETDETPQCKDFGDLNGDYGDETDIDGEERIKYGRVDIGGDEYYYSPADFNDSGNVDFIDYAMLAGAWQTTPNDVNDYNDIFDLQDNNSIDFDDLALFCEDWLWEKGWGDEGWMMCMGGGGMGFGFEGLESGELMMLDMETILATRPERLVAKSQKFYDITPETTISARQKALDAQEVDIEQIIKEILEWLDGIWLDGDLKEIMTEEQYLEFRRTIEEFLK